MSKRSFSNTRRAVEQDVIEIIFSKTRRCDAPAAIDTWSQIGGTGMYATRRFSLYGRNSASGTYGYFKEHALCGGDFRDEVKVANALYLDGTVSSLWDPASGRMDKGRVGPIIVVTHREQTGRAEKAAPK